MTNRKPRLTAKTADALRHAAMLCDDQIFQMSHELAEKDRETEKILRRASRYLWKLARWKEKHDASKGGE